MNITEFKYRYNSDKEKALVLYRQARSLLFPPPFLYEEVNTTPIILCILYPVPIC